MDPKTLVKDGVEYRREELQYKVRGVSHKILIFTRYPGDISMMINNLVDFRAKEIAKVKLREIIANKVVELLNLT